MGEFFKSVKFKVILCVIIILAGVALYSVSRNGQIIGGSQIISTALNPIKKFSNAISNKVEKTIDVIVKSKDYSKENDKLRDENNELKKRLIEYEDMKIEIEDLRKFVGIKEDNPDFKLSPPCTIISRVTNDPYGSFVIDKGTDHGIKIYDPVVTSDGLVGVIIETAKNYSTVRTILSPDLSIGGLCIESRDTGIVEGNINFSVNGKCKMIYIDKNNTIDKGDLIITSGNSGQFPQGYIIGNVEEVGVEESGLTSYAVITPAVDPTEINSVIVITDFNGNGDNSNED